MPPGDVYSLLIVMESYKMIGIMIQHRDSQILWYPTTLYPELAT